MTYVTVSLALFLLQNEHNDNYIACRTTAMRIVIITEGGRNRGPGSKRGSVGGSGGWGNGKKRLVREYEEL
jgi:hypothetical protein